MTQRDPGRLMQIAMGFWPAKTMLSAVELGVFTVLGDRSLTAPDLQDELGLHILAACDPLHLGGEDALPGRFELREIRRHFGLSSAGTNRIKLTESAG